jgi:hypothetical protein
MSARLRVALLAVTAVFSCASLRADFIPISQPSASYVNGTTLLDFTDPDFNFVDSLSGGGVTLTYDTSLDVRTVPTTWSAWGAPPAREMSTPRVGYTEGLPTLTISLSSAATTFGLEVEPDIFTTEETTVDFFSGSTLVGTIDLFPDGNAGALLFAASTTTDPFTSIVINNLEGDDFAIARQRFTLVPAPEPGTLALFALPAAVLYGIQRLRRKI